jgi:uncharacterized membrane protein
MKQRLFLFCAFGCIGITTEIFFTAIVDLIDMIQAGSVDLKLKGNSYIWMFPIYGLAGILFPLLMPYFEKFHALIRAAIYATGILIVEFITGALLDVFTGSCPWEYKAGWHIMGYIRLDYFPLWAGFGFMIETIVKFLSRFKV